MLSKAYFHFLLRDAPSFSIRDILVHTMQLKLDYILSDVTIKLTLALHALYYIK